MTSTQLAVPSLSYPVERTTLDNGLRVVISVDRRAPAVAVVVDYDVGIRSEPEGRTGFAHLFEHLMFQGSASLEKLEHFRYVQSSGGTFNGTTRFDYTSYFEQLPSNALERALFLEADRMRAPRITPSNLANQVAVVKEEIRVNVLNRPYGGFPWLLVPPVLFDTFANAHNGYGDFVDLTNATVDDAQAFFDRYYAPGNAVLGVGGDLDVDEALMFVERHFGDIPAREVPSRPSFAEPDLDGERRSQHQDPHAPTPAVGVAWRVPDPLADLDGYLPYVVLAAVLADGEASRLRRRLVRGDRLATYLSCYVSLMSDPFEVRDPTALVIDVFHPGPLEPVLEALEEELDRLATGGLEPGELSRVQARLAANRFAQADSILRRTLAMTVLEQQRGRAELIGELPSLIADVTAEQVLAAAAALRPERRAILEIVPGGRS